MSEHDEDATVHRVFAETFIRTDIIKPVLAALKPGDRLPGDCEVVSSADLRTLRDQMLVLNRELLMYVENEIETAKRLGADVTAFDGKIAEFRQQIKSATTEPRGQNADAG